MSKTILQLRQGPLQLDLDAHPLLNAWLRAHPARVPGVHWPDGLDAPSKQAKQATRARLQRLAEGHDQLAWLRFQIRGVNDMTLREDVRELARVRAVDLLHGRPGIVKIDRHREEGYHGHVLTADRDAEEFAEYAALAGTSPRDLDNLTRYLCDPYDARAKNTHDAQGRRRVPPSFEDRRDAAELLLAWRAYYRALGGRHPQMRFGLNWAGF